MFPGVPQREVIDKRLHRYQLGRGMKPLSTVPADTAIDTRQDAYPLVGVVTPVRNRRAFSVAFAQQLASQDFPLFQTLIVDSASTDGTPDALRALQIAGLSVIEAPSSAYWTEATNIGVTRALADGCEYVLTLNDDVVFPPTLVSSLVSAAIRADVQMVGSTICYAKEPARIWGVGAFNNWEEGAFLQTGWGNRWEDALPRCEGSNNDLVKVEALCGNGTLIHRSVFERIGLYDQKHAPHYHADAEFTMRAAREGIDAWVALEARLYNYFNDLSDGPFASKNLSFFSLRSANYIRPLLYILLQYCPVEDRVVALCRYFAKYLTGFSLRQRSKLLRAAGYVSGKQVSRSQSLAYFLPPLDPALTVVEDLEILRLFPPRDFASAAYMYLLRRACSDDELDMLSDAILRGKPRNDILIEMVESPEFMNLPRSHSLSFVKAAASGFNSQQLPEIVSESELLLLVLARSKNRVPTRQEFELGPNQLNASASLSQSRRLLAGKRSEGEQSPPESHEAGTWRPLSVYTSVDVLCMALDDPRARTGVYRYVLAITRQFAQDSRMRLRLFYSPQLKQQWSRLISLEPTLSSLEADQWIPDSGAAVFYPYFPLDGRDRRYAHLPTFVTICDLFPLTNPEWFTAEASQRFRQQTRLLVDADHVFCISEATRQQLKEVFPHLKMSSSVAYLAVDPPRSLVSDSPISGVACPAEYFLCVGTIEPRKNLENVIRAFHILQQRQDTSDLHMLVVGQAGWKVEESEVSALVGEHSSKINFLGNVADAELWRLYQGAVCTVFPSLAEGFGLPIIESFACGTPVVTSRNSSMAEISDGGAILVNPRDPSEIAAAIARIATDRQARSSLGSAALARAADFSWEKCAEDHILEFARITARVDEARRILPSVSASSLASDRARSFFEIL
jgi:glycosyltransferase involved in cell wall biosynthesis/GT2 family glycosyltransferase